MVQELEKIDFYMKCTPEQYFWRFDGGMIPAEEARPAQA